VVFFFSFFFGHRSPFVSIKNQTETAIAMTQMQIETMARALTMSSGSKWLLYSKIHIYFLSAMPEGLVKLLSVL
jgi:hypothetical protein